MTKYLWIAIAILGLGLAALGLLYRSEVRKGAQDRERLQTATDALDRVAVQRKKDLATLAARARENRATGLELAQAQEALQKALQAEKGWSDTEVPEGVRKALTEDSDASISKPN